MKEDYVQYKPQRLKVERSAYTASGQPGPVTWASITQVRQREPARSPPDNKSLGLTSGVSHLGMRDSMPQQMHSGETGTKIIGRLKNGGEVV